MRARRWWSIHHWWVVGCLAAAALALGIVGFRSYFGPGGRPFTDVLYLSLQLFVLESGSVAGPLPWTLEVARFLAPAVGAYAVAALVLQIARDEISGLQARFRRHHVVVCGLDMGAPLARQVRAGGTPVVVIEPDEDHPEIEGCRDRHVTVLVGDSRDEHVLRKAGVRRAQRVYVLTPQDEVNMRTAEQVRLLAESGATRAGEEPLRVLVHLGDAQLANLLAARELGRTSAGVVRLDFFDIHSATARALLGGLSGALVPGPDGRAHIGVVGLGRLGTQLVVQAGRTWLADLHDPDDRLLVSVADTDVAAKLRWLTRRYPVLDRTCELRPVELPTDPGGLVDRAALDSRGWPPISCVFVCWHDDVQGLGVSIALHESLGGQVPVVARAHGSDLAALLPTRGATLPRLRVFDPVEMTCRPGMILAGPHEQLARAFHETYVRQRAVAGDAADDNPSMTTWDRLSEEKKESNRSQAEDVGAKLATLGLTVAPLSDPGAELVRFSTDELDQLAELEHVRWCRTASADDPDNVPWSELPEDRRDIDRVFIRRLPALLATVGLQIEPDRRAHPGPG